MKMRIGCIALILCLLVATSGQATEGSSKYCSIMDIQKEASTGWKQTYTVKDKEITIDVHINVPEVDKFPIYVTELQSITAEEESGYTYFHCKKGAIYIDEDNGKLYTNGAHTYMENGQAENCITPPDQVAPIFSKILEKNSLVPIVVVGQVAESRAYEYKPIDDEGQIIGVKDPDIEYSDIDFSKELSKQGYYYVLAHQSLQGIPVFHSEYFNLDIPNARNMPFVRIFALLYDEQNYSFEVTGWMKIVDTYEQDIPLLPLSQIKKILEQHISAGEILEIYRMSLGVMPYYLSDGQEGDPYVMIPVWEIHHNYGFTDNRSGHQYYVRNIAGEPLRINAQTGEVLDREEADDDKRTLAPSILTWEQLQEQ